MEVPCLLIKTLAKVSLEREGKVVNETLTYDTGLFVHTT